MSIKEQKKNKQLICLLDIDCGRKWSKSVLGKTIDITINGRKYVICTPKLPGDCLTLGSLESPDITKNFRRDAGAINYGSVMDLPSCNSIINTIILTTSVNSEQEAKDIAKIIEKNINEYVERFLKYITILSDNDFQIETEIKKRRLAQFVYQKDSISKNISLPREQFIDINIELSSKPPKNSAVKKSLDLLSINQKIPLEFEYYLSSKYAYEAHDYRKSVLDSATASEISITKRLDELIKNQSPPIKKKKLLEDYQELGRKIKLLKIFGENVSELNFDTIRSPRNRTIHAGAEIDPSTARDSLVSTRKVLLRYSKFW